MSGTVLSADEVAEYMQRLTLVKEALSRLGRGAQQEASFDIRVAPSMVSSVVRGRYLDVGILEKLELWAADAMVRELGQQVEVASATVGG